MNAIYLTLFVSLILVLFAVLLYGYSARQRDQDHSERLALLPLDDDVPAPKAQASLGAEGIR